MTTMINQNLALQHFLQTKQAEVAKLQEKVAVLLGLLDVALGNMDRARSILTDNQPRETCNWGMLDTASLRRTLTAVEDKWP